MVKKNKKTLFESWKSLAFLAGFVIALLFGIIGVSEVVAWILIVLGLFVGFININKNEAQQFLVSGAVLVIVSALGFEAMSIIPLIGSVLNAILLLFIPATIIVSLRSVFDLAKN